MPDGLISNDPEIPIGKKRWRRSAMAIDEAKLQQLLGKMLGDAGAAMSIGLVILGDTLGLYKAMAAAGPLTSGDLAARTGTAPR